MINDLKNKRVIITGASAGIGRALAQALASKQCELFLVARREDKLKSLQNELECKSHIIVGDINDVKTQEDILKQIDGKIDILINNAGLALGKDSVAHSEISEMEQMIATNITSVFSLTRRVLPLMIQEECGDILNVCSIAGHNTYKGGAVYCATKHALHAFTKTLREETCHQNIRVMQISPGMVDTEFSTVRFKGNKDQADSVYQGMTPLYADDIARMMVFMLEQPKHVVIDEIITMPTGQGSATTVAR
ncbi:MAG: NAD(P)-dependent oxidoreductase [Halobacteriovoraceae bacterium]|nr:NAD(P)-dependent oxidoreductase [Halobacteriovoraceae bacterium]|tara:strand:- start:18978 stop:19727 length:750 start_codon:yes stop_codon:yes gene_type:complete